MPKDNEEHFELDFGEPDEKLLEWAKENIHEDPDTKYQKVSDLRDRIYAEGECCPHRTDDHYLLRFLRARNFNLTKAYDLLVSYYEFKETCPELFQNVDTKKFTNVDCDVIDIPPFREDSGRRMLIFKFGKWDTSFCTVEEIYQVIIFLTEVALMEQRTQILGSIVIFDFADLTMNQALHMTPSAARKLVKIMATAMPVKIHELHILNQSYIFDIGYSFFKPFLSEKMKQRIFFHGSHVESLHKHINPKYLPVTYGGATKHYSCSAWIPMSRTNETIHKEMTELGYDLSDY